MGPEDAARRAQEGQASGDGQERVAVPEALSASEAQAAMQRLKVRHTRRTCLSICVGPGSECVHKRADADAGANTHARRASREGPHSEPSSTRVSGGGVPYSEAITARLLEVDVRLAPRLRVAKPFAHPLAPLAKPQKRWER
jgi:hypothetical protein